MSYMFYSSASELLLIFVHWGTLGARSFSCAVYGISHFSTVTRSDCALKIKKAFEMLQLNNVPVAWWCDDQDGGFWGWYLFAGRKVCERSRSGQSHNKISKIFDKASFKGWKCKFYSQQGCFDTFANGIQGIVFISIYSWTPYWTTQFGLQLLEIFRYVGSNSYKESMARQTDCCPQEW